MNKISINIRLELLGECNKKDLKRLFDKSIGLKPMAYVHTVQKTVEVTDPSVTAKGFSRVLLQSMRRNMQIFAVRAKDGLKAIDKAEKDPKKQKALVEKLKQTMVRTKKEMSAKAESNLKQIIEEATKDAPKWDKARDARNSMSEVDSGNKDLEKTVQKLEDSLIVVSSNIEKAKEKEGPDRIKKLEQDVGKKLKKLQITKRDDLGDLEDEIKYIQEQIEVADKDKLADLKKQEAKLQKQIIRKNRDFDSGEKELEEELEQGKEEKKKDLNKEIKGYAKDALEAFSSYRQGRKGFDDTLKKTLSMSKMIDNKSKESEVIAQLHDMLKKKVRPAAEGYRKYLDDCDKNIKAVVSQMGGNKSVTEAQIKDALPKPKSPKANVLFKEFKAVQSLMKREKIK